MVFGCGYVWRFIAGATILSSMSSPMSQLAPCPVREQMIAELEEAHARFVLLNNRDVRNIVQGDRSEVSGEELTEARTRRERALEEVRQHIAFHEC
jgi:hypothetical protein